MDNFITFLESLRTEDNSSTIDTIIEGYSVINVTESLYHSIPVKMNATMIELIQKARILEKHFKELIMFVKSVDLAYIVEYIKKALSRIKEGIRTYNFDDVLLRQVNEILRYVQHTVSSVKSNSSNEYDQVNHIVDDILMNMMDMVSLYGKYRPNNISPRITLT